MKKYITQERWKLRIRRKQVLADRKLKHLPTGGRPYAYAFEPREAKEEVVIKAPSYFSFVYNTEEMLQFFESIREVARDRYRIFIDLSGVNQISADAIAVFVSTIKAARFTNFRGNVPQDKVSEEIFTQSGIFRFINSGRSLSQQPDKGRIADRRSQIVEPRTANELIDFATRTLTGGYRKCGGVYSTLIECMSNTHNHASAKSGIENWWATVYCFPETCVASFTFVDCGVGIFKSVKLAMIRRIIRKSLLMTNADLLKDIFHERVASRTGLYYRGKGLPKIFKTLNRGDITNLIVVSNDAYARPGEDEYRPLKRNFKGTVLYWELQIPPITVATDS